MDLNAQLLDAARARDEAAAERLMREGASPLAGRGAALSALASFAGPEAFEAARAWLSIGRDEAVEAALSEACASGNAAWARGLAPLAIAPKVKGRAAFIAGKKLRWECFEACGGARWMDDVKMSLVVGAAAQASDWTGVDLALGSFLACAHERRERVESVAPRSGLANRTAAESEEGYQRLWSRAAKVAARLDEPEGARAVASKAPSGADLERMCRDALTVDAARCVKAWMRPGQEMSLLAEALAKNAPRCVDELLPLCDPRAQHAGLPLIDWAATPELAAKVEARSIGLAAGPSQNSIQGPRL